MQGAIGLLLYIAAMVLGSILKKMAQDRARQGAPSMPGLNEVYQVSFDEVGAEDSQQAGDFVEESVLDTAGTHLFDLTIAEGVRELQSQGVDDFGDWDDWDDEDDGIEGDRERRKIPEDSESRRLNEAMLPLGSDWAQAVLLSEIIREPRAKRAWPHR